MNEAETRAEYIDPQLKSSGWGEVDESKVLREFRITDGKINVGGRRNKPEIADYILVYKNVKIGVIEAKRDELDVSEGVMQAKSYAEKLHIDYTYSSNGKEIYEICISTGKEKLIDRFPTPEELWNKTFSDQNEWKNKFHNQEFETGSGFFLPDESASPSFILSTSTEEIFDVPINFFGFDNQRNSTPSSSALYTSRAEPGIFSLSLLYKHFTDFAFCLTAVLTHSIPVSPPPMTMVSLFSALSMPLSKFFTLSPKPFRLDAVKNSIAGKIFFKSEPGKLISRGL